MNRTYMDNIERPIDPPDEDDLFEEDPTIGNLEYQLYRVHIIVDEDGYFDFKDPSCPWADKIDTYVDTVYGDIEVTYADELIEITSDLIYDEIPNVPGEYEISCGITLVFKIDGILSDSEVYDDDIEIEYFTDDAEISLDSKASIVYDFQCIPVV